MKTACLLLLSTLLFSGCQFHQYDTNSIYRLNLPSYPHAYQSKIFYEDDSVQFDQPVVEVKSLRVNLNPAFDKEMITDTLQAISREFGYDIIAVKSKKNISWDESDNSFFEYMLAALAGEELDASYTTYTAKRLEVTGYKYLSNILYADRLTKSRTTYEIDENDQKLFVAEQTLLPSGQQQDLRGNERVFQKIHHFSELYFLQQEDEDWQFRWTDRGALIRTNKKLKYKISFDTTNTKNVPVEVLMKTMETPFTKYNISLFYNSSDQIVSKAVLKEGQPFASFDYLYDDKSRILKEEIYFEQYGQRFEILYDYYDQDSLWKILSPRNMHKEKFYSGG